MQSIDLIAVWYYNHSRSHRASLDFRSALATGDPMFIMMLKIWYTDGSTFSLTSNGNDWRAGNSPVW